MRATRSCRSGKRVVVAHLLGGQNNSPILPYRPHMGVYNSATVLVRQVTPKGSGGSMVTGAGIKDRTAIRKGDRQLGVSASDRHAGFVY